MKSNLINENQLYQRNYIQLKYKFELNPIISIFHDFVTNQVINEVSVYRTCSLDLLRQN